MKRCEEPVRTPQVLYRDEKGASILESMVAFAVFALAAVAVFPVYQAAKRQTKFGDSRTACQNIVRAKLDQYRQGRLASLQDARLGTGDFATTATPQNAVPNPALANLTFPSLAASAGAAAQTAGGFAYAKLRYNRYFPTICRGTSSAAIFGGARTATLASVGITTTLGIRECISNSTATGGAPRAFMTDVAGAACTGATEGEDQRVAAEIPGFKLYVKLELDTPWRFSSPGWTPTGDARFDDNCPNRGVVADQPVYDFDGASDGIRITVTGVMDTLAGGGNGVLGDLDPNLNPPQFFCSASATIRPEQPIPVRYYSSTDGRLYAISGSAAAFRTIYTQSVGGMQATGILAFSVHPRNLSLYVLRPGSLVRYSNCFGQPIDCTAAVGATNGFSDTGVPNWPAMQEFRIPANIRGIGIDYRTGRVYGLTGDKTALLEITVGGAPLASSNAVGPTPVAVTTLVPGTAVVGAPGTAPFLYYAPPGQTRALRFTGFFLDHGGDAAYVSDLASSLQFGSTSYTSSVYLASDFQLTNPIAKLPVAATSFSK